jgi:YidC/Oxa1 family membrane protein insertase
MDRNQAIGLVLISLLLIAYFQFFAPEPKPQEESAQTESVQPATPEQSQTQEPDNSRIQDQETAPDDNQLANQFGIFAPAAKGKSEIITLENNQIEISFNSRGATPFQVWLKEFETASLEPLILMDSLSSQKSLVIHTGNKVIDLYKLYYQVEKSADNDTSRVSFILNLGSGQTIRHIYSLGPSGYQLKYKLETSGLANLVDNINPELLWVNNLKHLEKDITQSRIVTTVTYYTMRGDFDDLGERSADLEEETISEPVAWVGFKQHFFTEAIISKNGFTRAVLKTQVDEADPAVVKKAFAGLSLDRAQFLGETNEFTYYFGPNNYQILKKVTEGFSDNIYLGWPPINFVNKWLIIPIFNFLENYIGNYGIIIIILVLVIKILLAPLSYKSYVSMAKTKVLKPELDEIKAKHPDDMQKAQQEQMKLYQQVGVNPLSGCIPLLLQMPILFAMFYMFPNSIELRQEAFLWADDLSTYDSILSLPFNIPVYGDHVSLFTILMTASTILYTWSNNQITTVQGPMKTFSYLMPIIFMFVLNSFPASLSFYYFVSNIVTFGQQALIRRFVDEDKIKAILDENRLKNKGKKKSVFQLKLEEAMRTKEDAKKKKSK